MSAGPEETGDWCKITGGRSSKSEDTIDESDFEPQEFSATAPSAANAEDAQHFRRSIGI